MYDLFGVKELFLGIGGLTEVLYYMVIGSNWFN